MAEKRPEPAHEAPAPAEAPEEGAHEVDPKPWREEMEEAGQITTDVPEE